MKNKFKVWAVRPLFLVFFFLSSLQVKSQIIREDDPDEKLTVNVHPGVELFTIVQILGDKFPNPNPSTYSKYVMDYFGKYREHPAVKKVKSFKKVFPDLTELGWTMDDFPNIQIYEPTAELIWYKLNGKEETLEYINLCKDFFYDTKFWDFYQAHAKKYEIWGEAIKSKIAESNVVKQLQYFYQFKSAAKWYICIDPLNSWGSHAITTKNINPKFSNVIAYNTGYFNTKSTIENEPMFEYKGFDYLIWHEGSHVFLEPLFSRYKKEIEELSYLFNETDEGMKRNGIGNWEYCLNENVVRSVVGCLYKVYKTDREFKRQVAKETANDFIYVEDLVSFISKNYSSNKKYRNFEAFFPEILKFLKKKYPVKVS